MLKSCQMSFFICRLCKVGGLFDWNYFYSMKVRDGHYHIVNMAVFWRECFFGGYWLNEVDLVVIW